MAESHDDVIETNAGSGGANLDVSTIRDVDGTTIAVRERTVIGGEESREAVVEPRRIPQGGYALPHRDDTAEEQRERIIGLLERCVELLEAMADDD